jgi:hypothetical protein
MRTVAKWVLLAAVGSCFLVAWYAHKDSGTVAAHARRYVITLSGRGEIELAGGQKIMLEPGHVLLAEDLTGKGHIARALTADWTAMFVQLDQ